MPPPETVVGCRGEFSFAHFSGAVAESLQSEPVIQSNDGSRPLATVPAQLARTLTWGPGARFLLCLPCLPCLEFWARCSSINCGFRALIERERCLLNSLQFPVLFRDRNLEQWRNNGGHEMRVIYSVQGPHPQRTLAACSPDSSLAVPVSRERDEQQPHRSTGGKRLWRVLVIHISSASLYGSASYQTAGCPSALLHPAEAETVSIESSRLRVPLAPTPERWTARRR